MKYELDLYDKWCEGKEEGIKEGRREGMQVGRKEGLSEGLQKGREEGIKAPNRGGRFKTRCTARNGGGFHRTAPNAAGRTSTLRLK